MIENYEFGKIIIDKKEYNHDVEVRWNGEVLKWWRKEGHSVDLEDLKRALDQNPEIIVIGTGAYGVCEVKKECEKAIREKGIELIIENTGKAVKTFNKFLKESKKAIGLFHLTC